MGFELSPFEQQSVTLPQCHDVFANNISNCILNWFFYILAVYKPSQDCVSSDNVVHRHLKPSNLKPLASQTICLVAPPKGADPNSSGQSPATPCYTLSSSLNSWLFIDQPFLWVRLASFLFLSPYRIANLQTFNEITTGRCHRGRQRHRLVIRR